MSDDMGKRGPAGPSGPRGEPGIAGSIGPQGVRGAAAAIAPLVQSVEGLRLAVESLVKRAEKSERRIAGIVIAICIDLIFTGGFAALYYQQERTASELADTRAGVLCPQYSVFLGGYNPSTRAPGPDRDTYEQIYAQFRASYAHLDCQTPLVPKPTPTSAPAPPK